METFLFLVAFLVVVALVVFYARRSGDKRSHGGAVGAYTADGGVWGDASDPGDHGRHHHGGSSGDSGGWSGGDGGGGWSGGGDGGGGGGGGS